MAVYHGRNGAVYLSSTGSAAPSNLLKQANWTLDMSTQKIDVTNFDSTNQEFIQGWPNRSGTIAGFWDNTEDKPFAGADSADGVNLYLYPSKNAASKYFYGPAWIDSSIEVPVDGAVRVRMNFSPRGTWGRM